MKKINVVLLIIVFVICIVPYMVYADCASDAKNINACDACSTNDQTFYWKDGQCLKDDCNDRPQKGCSLARMCVWSDAINLCVMSDYDKSFFSGADQSFNDLKQNSLGNGFDDCEGLFGTPGSNPPDDVADYIQVAFNVIKFVGIILCILMTIIDYFKAIVSNEKEMLKAISKKALIRVIYIAVLFFVPSISEFLLSLIGVYGSCGIS